MDKIKMAAKDGGSSTFIAKLPNGFETVLQPTKTSIMAVADRNDEDAALLSEYDRMERSSAISGVLCYFFCRWMI